MSDWLKDGHRAVGTLYRVAYDLQDRGEALRKVGQDRLADHLCSLATTIEIEAAVITKSLSTAVAEQIGTAREHTTTILESVLAGVELGKQEGES